MPTNELSFVFFLGGGYFFLNSSWANVERKLYLYFNWENHQPVTSLFKGSLVYLRIQINVSEPASQNQRQRYHV